MKWQRLPVATRGLHTCGCGALRVMTARKSSPTAVTSPTNTFVSSLPETAIPQHSGYNMALASAVAKGLAGSNLRHEEAGG